MSTKKHIGLNLLQGVILIFILITACTTSPLETNIAPSTLPSIAPSATFAPEDTPTKRPTSTPIPTFTPTPPPEWVTNFAQPILDAIANRAPDFQDDFHDQSGGWETYRCADWRMKIIDGEMVVTAGATPGSTVGSGQCALHRNDIDYTDFVMEVEGRFLPETNVNSEWRINFRYIEGEVGEVDFRTRHSIGINYETRVLGVGLLIMNSPDLNLPDIRPQNGFNRLMVIAKGSKFAFYLNEQPFYYIESTYCPYGDFYLEVINRGNLLTDTIVAFDNFKIWNISNLP